MFYYSKSWALLAAPHSPSTRYLRWPRPLQFRQLNMKCTNTNTSLLNTVRKGRTSLSTRTLSRAALDFYVYSLNFSRADGCSPTAGSGLQSSSRSFSGFSWKEKAVGKTTWVLKTGKSSSVLDLKTRHSQNTALHGLLALASVLATLCSGRL